MKERKYCKGLQFITVECFVVAIEIARFTAYVNGTDMQSADFLSPLERELEVCSHIRHYRLLVDMPTSKKRLVDIHS
jgi:hypothetical protein